MRYKPYAVRNISRMLYAIQAVCFTQYKPYAVRNTSRMLYAV